MFIGKTNGSSCKKSRPKPLIQPQSSTRATPCAMPCGRLSTLTFYNQSFLIFYYFFYIDFPKVFWSVSDFLRTPRDRRDVQCCDGRKHHRMPRRGPLAFLKVEPPRKCTQHEADGVCGVVIFFTKSFWTDIALRISLSSVLLGLSLWASLFAFDRPQYTSGRDRPNRLQARQSACTGSFVCLYTRIHSRATHATWYRVSFLCQCMLRMWTSSCPRGCIGPPHAWGPRYILTGTPESTPIQTRCIYGRPEPSPVCQGPDTWQSTTGRNETKCFVRGVGRKVGRVFDLETGKEIEDRQLALIPAAISCGFQ